MRDSPWSTDLGRLLAVLCSAAAILGFVIAAGVFTNEDYSLGDNVNDNYEAAADNLEVMADNLEAAAVDQQNASPDIPKAPASSPEADYEAEPSVDSDASVSDPSVDEGSATGNTASSEQYTGDE